MMRRRRISAAALVSAAATLTADANVLATNRFSNKTVQYVDFGFTSAREFWEELVIPAYERFTTQPNRANAITASGHAWHVHEWIWHDEHPGDDTRNSIAYKTFQTTLIAQCPELAWIRDVADAGKHRGLGRPAEVRRVASGTRLVGGPLASMPLGAAPLGGGIVETTPLCITLTDSSTHGFVEVLSRVMNYWRAIYFS
jgi:hypothetical protein